MKKMMSVFSRRASLNGIPLVLLMTIVVVSTVGCFEEITSAEYEGDPKVQFDPDLSGSVLDTDGQVSASVALIASEYPPAGISGDIAVPVTVVDSQTTASDENYELLTPTITVPADSVFADDVMLDVSGVEIPPGEEREVVVALNESEDGTVTPAANFQTFTLTIVGQTANIVADPTSVSFGEVSTDSTATDTIDVANLVDGLAGTLESEIGNFEIAGEDADVFDFAVSMDDESDLDQTTLVSEGSTQILVEFAPSDTIDYQAQLTFDITNDPDAENLAIGLTGAGAEPDEEGN